MLIHNNIRNFILGTLVFLTGVPFCFGQGNAYLQQQVSHNFLHEDYEQDFLFTRSLLSLRGAEQRSNLKIAADTLKSDTTSRKPVFKKFRMKKSPWLAVGLSAILPGAGQFYNRSYWKVPILLALTGYLAYEYYDNDKKYRDYRDQYAASQSPENQYLGDPYLKTLREFYRNQRNDFVWYFAILYVVNLVDAYVDAHLFDFTVKEDKLTRFGLTDREFKLNVRVKF